MIRASWTDTNVKRWCAPPSVKVNKAFLSPILVTRMEYNSVRCRKGEDSSTNVYFTIIPNPSMAAGMSIIKATLGIKLELGKIVIPHTLIVNHDLPNSLQRSFLHCYSSVMLCNEWSIATGALLFLQYSRVKPSWWRKAFCSWKVFVGLTTLGCSSVNCIFLGSHARNFCLKPVTTKSSVVPICIFLYFPILFFCLFQSLICRYITDIFTPLEQGRRSTHLPKICVWIALHN